VITEDFIARGSNQVWDGHWDDFSHLGRRASPTFYLFWSLLQHYFQCAASVWKDRELY